MKNLSDFLDEPRNEYAPWEVFKAQKLKPQAAGKPIKSEINVNAQKEAGYLCCFDGCEEVWVIGMGNHHYCRKHFRDRK